MFVVTAVISKPALRFKVSAVTPPTAVADSITTKSPALAPWLLSVQVIVVLPLVTTSGLLKFDVVFLRGVTS